MPYENPWDSQPPEDNGGPTTFNVHEWLKNKGTQPAGMPTFDSPQDWLDYVGRAGYNKSSGEADMFNKMSANPGGYYSNGGTIMKSPNAFEKMLPYLALGAMAIPVGGVGALGGVSAGTGVATTGATSSLAPALAGYTGSLGIGAGTAATAAGTAAAATPFIPSFLQLPGVAGGTGVAATHAASSLVPGTVAGNFGGAGAKMGIEDILKGLVKKPTAGDVISGVGKGIGNATQAAATNRGVNIEADIAEAALRQRQQEALFDQLTKREEGQRTSGNDALQTLLRTNYIQNKQPDQAPVTSSGRTLSTMGLGARNYSDSDRLGAKQLGTEASGRLQNGYSVPTPTMTPFTINPDYRNPSTMEKVGNAASIGAGGLGSLWDLIFNKGK